jgi:transposase
MMRNDKLSQAIGDAGWSGFLSILKTKAQTRGVRVVEVDARGTSQTCPECGRVAKKKLSQRRHECPCGCSLDRDHAAARVILARGLNGGVPLPAGDKPGERPGGDAVGGRVCQRNLSLANSSGGAARKRTRKSKAT